MLKEIIDTIGKEVNLKVENDIIIKVIVKDVRKVWGRIDFLIEPVAGEGEKWVSSERIYN